MLRFTSAGVLLLLVGCLSGDSAVNGGEEPALCSPKLPAASYGYSDADAPIPPHFLSSTLGTVAFTDNSSDANRITNAGATLGRVLFYDVRLSSNNRTSCASCHRQEFGFGDTARFSMRANGHRLPRHTMALANARFNAGGKFFWDERASSLELQVVAPIHDSLEMNMALDSLPAKLVATEYYRGLFAAAFGSPNITTGRVAAALAQFIRSLVSSDSRFDAVFATGGAPDDARLTAAEREGYALFQSAGCVICHRTIAMIADQASNTGLDVAPADTGAGKGRFKPPSLRNIAVRPPYMHDGRFTNLREVVDFYSTGVRDTPGLDPRLRGADGKPRALRLNATQRAALVSFLEALTDSAFLHSEKFSNPFPCRR